MKKITGFLILLALSSFTSISTNGLHFKVEYKPETRYDETLEQTSAAKITYSGSDDFLQKLKDNGMTNPTLSSKNSKTVEVLKTYKLKDNTHFPITMEFKNTDTSEGQPAIPEGTVIYGTCTVGSMPTFDSIHSPGMQDETKEEFMKIMASTLSQITFPDKEMSVGDSFTQVSPVSVPIAGVTINMNITTVYKLISIDGGQANFDITQYYTMSLDKYITEGGGSGNGHIVFDITHGFYSSYEENADMHLKLKTDDFSLEVQTKNTIKQTIAFSKN